MRYNKRVLSLVLAGAMALGLLSGCGNKAETSKDSTQKETSAEAKTEKKTEIGLCLTMDLPKDEVTKLVNGFEAEHPNIKLNIVESAKGSQQDKVNKLTVQLVSGKDIDVYDFNQTGYYQFATLEAAKSLNDLIEKNNFDTNLLGKDVIEQSKIKGQLYGLPYRSSYWMMVYNKDLFDAVNEPYPTGDWTWDEFREVAKRVSTGTGADKKWGYATHMWPATWTGHAMQAGAKFTVDEETSGLDHDGYREALQLRYDMTLVDETSPSYSQMKITKYDPLKDFSSGNVAMVMSGDWLFGTIKQNLNGEYPFEYDVVELPHPEGQEAKSSWGGARYLGINNSSSEEKQQAGFELIEYLTTGKGAEVFASNGLLTPFSSEEIMKAYTASFPEFIKNAGIMFQPHKHVEEKAFHVASAQINAVLKEEADLYLTGGKDLESTLKDMKRRTDEEIKKVLANNK